MSERMARWKPCLKWKIVWKNGVRTEFGRSGWQCIVHWHVVVACSMYWSILFFCLYYFLVPVFLLFDSSIFLNPYVFFLDPMLFSYRVLCFLANVASARLEPSTHLDRVQNVARRIAHWRGNPAKCTACLWVITTHFWLWPIVVVELVAHVHWFKLCELCELENLNLVTFVSRMCKLELGYCCFPNKSFRWMRGQRDRWNQSSAETHCPRQSLPGKGGGVSGGKAL